MEKALSPKVELGVCSMKSKLLLFRSSLLTVLIDLNLLMQVVFIPCRALKVRRMILNLILCWIGSQYSFFYDWFLHSYI